MKQIIEFDIDKQNLLRDVISKQTGSLNKAIKELFQNSFDAEATEIRVTIDQDGLRFIDNGNGMGEWEIDQYFKVFGATPKRGDGKKVGEFGMGRGQFFNFGKVLWRTQYNSMVVDIKKSLSYLLFDNSNKDYVDGTDIIISFYKKIYSWDASNTCYIIKNDILPPEHVDIYINGEIYKPKVKNFKDFSNDDYFVFTSQYHKSKIYNGNLAVKGIMNSNYKYSVMPYEKLQVNFARNELIENTESSEKLLNFIYDMEELMASQKEKFDLDEGKNILKMLNFKRIDISSVYDKKIVPLSNLKLVSIKEIVEDESMGVVFGKKNIWSDDCIRNDYKVISSSIETIFRRINKIFELEIEFIDKDTRELSRRGFHRPVELNTLKRNKIYFYIALELNDYIFSNILEEKEGLREIRLGLSDIAQAWTNIPEQIIYIDRNYIDSIKNREEAILRLWVTLCHEYAHDTSNTKEDYHNHGFYQQFTDYISITTKLLSSAFKYINRKYIKEKYMDKEDEKIRNH